MKYVCDVCGYIYDPEIGDPDNGIDAGTAFEALPEDWVCPLCGVGKEDFSPEERRLAFPVLSCGSSVIFKGNMIK